MSRESEKVLKELQKFLDAHAEDTKNEADADALTERFFAEYNQKCIGQKDHAPGTADDQQGMVRFSVSPELRPGKYAIRCVCRDARLWRFCPG